MRLTITSFLSVLFVSAIVKADLNENCVVKNKYNGICTYLTDCPYYDYMIQNYEALGLKSQEVFQIFREVNCGFISVNALVCCPPKSVTEGLTPQPNNAAPQGSNNNQGMSPSENSPSSNVPVTSTASTTQAPVNSGRPLSPSTTTTTSTTAPDLGSPQNTGFPNPPTSQTINTEKPIVTTTPVAPQTTTKATTYEGLDIEKFKRLLPTECGRVLMFKYFRGNRTEFDDFPWATLIEYATPSGRQFGCGGALFHNRYVLTAAHCVANLPPSWTISGVRFGEYDTDTTEDCLPDGPNVTICNVPPVDVSIEQVIVHSEFQPNDDNRLHDIALLRLAQPVKFTDIVKPICLPTKETFLQKYYTSGWGKDIVNNSITNGTNLKYMSYVSLRHSGSCEKKYAENGVPMNQNHLCGGILNEKPCIGDGGGPLMGLEELTNLEKRVAAFGILSLHKSESGSCQSGNPGVYTKVLDYVNWILDNINE